jgi:predicted DNA binding CopG/RHH family protein
MTEYKENLTLEELEIEKDLENGLYETITDNEYKKEIMQSAKSYKQQKKDGIFTIRTNKAIMEKVKKRAEEEDGLNYQSLINMLLFKYANRSLSLRIE